MNPCGGVLNERGIIASTPKPPPFAESEIDDDLLIVLS
jgi:hypothetical protein